MGTIPAMHALLGLIALVLVIVAVVRAVNGDLLGALLLVLLACAVGPGGWSLLT